MTSSSPPLVNRHDVTPRSAEAGDISFARRRLGAKAGALQVGCSHFEVPPGARQMPVHQHADEEEIFYVLGGSGLSWQDGAACTVGPGDCVVHPAGGKPHTFLAGDDGLELLAYSTNARTHLAWLPRAKVMWAGSRWVPVDGAHPFEAEAAAGPLERPEPGERPPNVVALAEVEPNRYGGGSEARRLGDAAGAVDSGLNHVTLAPGQDGAPFHCHALEEELFVILDGSGTLRLGEDEHPLREGDVIARPPATGVAHALGACAPSGASRDLGACAPSGVSRDLGACAPSGASRDLGACAPSGASRDVGAGDNGLTYLAYGTKVAGDSVLYPDLGKVRLRGLGVTLDVALPG